MTTPLFPELAGIDWAALPPGAALLAEGRSRARLWPVGRNLFLDSEGVASEAEYKRRAAAAGRMMQHAHIGFRSAVRTVDAIREVHGRCAEAGVRVDRFGITLDWSMGYPVAERARRARGTGIVLAGPEDVASFTAAAPAAMHFGDFMLGLPGAVENTSWALAAGVTTIGNLGQYFTFRLPDWDDELATTEATLTALGLIAAQSADVLVHSNLDDGFAGLFADMSAALGMVLIEKYIIEELVGAQVSHCYGHHFTAPRLRLSFHHALAQITRTPGSMIFGNTVSYKSRPSANYASLATYLQADIWSLHRQHTGHAINPVPITENERIPDIDEIIDVQIFAGRLAEHARPSIGLIDFGPIDEDAARLIAGAERFSAAVLAGLGEAGIDTRDAAQLMLALRRIGPARLEALFGPGQPMSGAWSGRLPLVPAEWLQEIMEETQHWLEATPAADRAAIGKAGLRVCIASSDVHEHGKTLIGQILSGLGVVAVDAGVSVDPDDLVALAVDQGCNAIAVGTYNGIALRYAREVQAALAKKGQAMPVCLGGRLNQVPEDSNSGLPVDVTQEISALGALPCESPAAMIAALAALARGQAGGC